MKTENIYVKIDKELAVKMRIHNAKTGMSIKAFIEAAIELKLKKKELK